MYSSSRVEAGGNLHPNRPRRSIRSFNSVVQFGGVPLAGAHGKRERTMTWQTMTWHRTEMNVARATAPDTTRDTTMATSVLAGRDARWLNGGLGAAVVA